MTAPTAAITPRLGERLVARGVLSLEDRDAALHFQQAHQVRLVELLIAEGLASELQVWAELAAIWGTPHLKRVSRLGGPEGKVLDAGEDLVCGLDPDVWPGGIIVQFDVHTNRVLQGTGTAMCSTSELLVSELSEPPLHLVDPESREPDHWNQ